MASNTVLQNSEKYQIFSQQRLKQILQVLESSTGTLRDFHFCGGNSLGLTYFTLKMFLRLTARFLAVLRLKVNPIETLFKQISYNPQVAETP